MAEIVGQGIFWAGDDRVKILTQEVHGIFSKRLVTKIDYVEMTLERFEKERDRIQRGRYRQYDPNTRYD